MSFGIEIFIILFFVACFAGFLDAMAGGGGLITIPALFMAGLPPSMVLGTNKLQSTAGAFSASLYFYRSGMIELRDIKLIVLMSFVGGICGATLVQVIHADILKNLLPFLTFIIGLYFLFTPNIGQQPSRRRISYVTFAFSMSLTIGFYDGLFGAGSGSMLCLAFITLLGFSISKATAYAKVLNFASSFASLCCFIIGKEVYFPLGFTMLAGQLIGARLGAKLVVNRGQTFIRPLVVVMSFLLTLKIVYDQGWFNHLSHIL
ncbi:hypothetical protein A6A19_02420 [Actinobacillus delphinicola]|uniref:TSUP family transporter n=1 Tax=Actinobacillus delphinicola TaxID=51161 RepID=UPI002442AAC5|nr:TSUP family transporter [Actinobacillus delphinicola]MDG6896881.1 hypothetical protein [Actinobacillus delphinicola]